MVESCGFENGEIEIGRKDFEDYLDERGMLTERDRLYLVGEMTYDKAQSEKKRRQRIRNRLLTGFLDLNLAANYLDQRDRELLFQALIDSPPFRKGWKEQMRHTQLGGIQETIAFIYEGLQERSNMSAQRVFIQALNQEDWVHTTPENLDEIIKKLSNGEQLTVDDYALIVTLLEKSPSERSARVFDNSESGDHLNRAVRRINLMGQLADRDLPDLWQPVLEAAGLSYTDASLQNLKEKTKEAENQTNQRDEPIKEPDVCESDVIGDNFDL